jgi:nitrite reductase/ring-hydroxylating ferredoxin subunit
MRARLVEIAREIAAHGKAGTLPQADAVYRVPASHYTDPTRFALERERVFKRLPLMLALTAELPGPGDYKALYALDVPVLIVRGDDGAVRAFVNTCAHRGAQVVPEGRGTASRFSCPYHAWSYRLDGALAGVFREREFGVFDKSCLGLPALPAAERAGLIWVTLDPRSTLDIDRFLAGYDGCLAQFGFERWHPFSSRVVQGPNWKIAYDGYLDFYHLPILHRNTFGPNMFSQAMYHAWGPHQRVSTPNGALADVAESEWTTAMLLGGVWTIFPHVSIASFDAGGRGVLISQLFPGATVAESTTVQYYLLENAPAAEAVAAVEQQVDFLEHVVRHEDYATGLRQQKALATGARPHVLFGRNEGGGQRFHRFVDTLLETPDDRLQDLFGDAACR